MDIIDVEVSEAADSLYIRFSNEPISHSMELSPDIILDLSADNTVIGVDMQHVSAWKDETRIGGVTRLLPTESRVRLQLVPS